MLRASIAMAIALLFAGAAGADEASKRAKVERLLEVQGTRASIAGQLEMARRSISELGRQQMMQNDLELPPDLMAIYERGMARLVEALERSLAPDDFVASWAEKYAANVSETDLDAILAYWESSTGQADLAATRGVSSEWTAEFHARTSQATSDAIAEMKEYLKSEIEKVRAGSATQ